MHELHCTLFAGVGLNSVLSPFPELDGKHEKQINLSSSSKWSVAGLVDNMLVVALELECNTCYSQTCYKCCKVICKSHLVLVSNQQLGDVLKYKATNRRERGVGGWGGGRKKKKNLLPLSPTSHSLPQMFLVSCSSQAEGRNQRYLYYLI